MIKVGIILLKKVLIKKMVVIICKIDILLIKEINYVNDLICWKMKEKFVNYICLLFIVFELKILELIYC